jgi:putative ABC transport system substrate-binding protein
MTAELGVKRLQLLKETIPHLSRVAVLWNPDTPFHPRVVEQFKTVVPSLSLKLMFIAAHRVSDFGAAFSSMSRSHAQALYIIDDGFFWGHRTTLLKMAMKARVPVIYGTREFVDEGALIYYGVSLADQARQAARYIDKIVKGAQPGDLPIEQPSKFELMINLRTAETLGIKIPESILSRADQVIQ